MNVIENISDTARWVAVYRARESERPNALFHDPFARRLAGTEGDAIATSLKKQDRNEWAYVMRTLLFDNFIQRQIDAGVDTIVNLAAGLDARPYRMNLSSSLRWFEVDLPPLLAYKESVLRDATPRCTLERVAVDLTDRDARRALFDRIDADARRTLVICEGLLIYLTPDENRALATDLAARRSFRDWVFDIASPGLVRMLMKQVGRELDAANAPLIFGPIEGPRFFEPSGWSVVDVKSSFKTASQLKRLPFPMNLFGFLPEKKVPGNQPWSGICLLKKTGAA